MSTDYEAFLANKQVRAADSGFDPGDSPSWLHSWQGDISSWACRKGRAAIFAGCGLGKTRMQLRWADEVAARTGRPVLLLTPLAVGPQTVAEAEAVGLDGVALCAEQRDVQSCRVAVANYQKLLAGHFDPKAFGGVVLDESSILKSYTGKTKQMLVDSFAGTPYRLCCTATPSPNDLMELGNHAEFLGVMPANEMLSRWFINDLSSTGTHRLKGHAQKDYWRWVASWAVCLDRPSDLGHPDGGYDLPPIEYAQHVVDSEILPAEGQLFASSKLTATSMHKEMRRTAADRAAKVAELVLADTEPWVVWCNTNYESDAVMALLLARAVGGVVEVRGAMSDAKKEEALKAFGDGSARVIVSKPSICGFGLNWQHCRNVAFLGLSFSHEQFYQAVRRVWRFGQARPVNVHVVIADGEGEVLAAIQRKEAQAEQMRKEMIKATVEGSEVGKLGLRPTENAVRIADKWIMNLGDCVEVASKMDEACVDLTVFSPPFAGLYIYSDGMADMGNAADDSEFFRHFGYLAPELLRITVPGRLCAVHCKDLPKYANRDGTAGLKDFPGELIRVMEGAGWSYHSRVTVWKCPVVERERTNTNGLLHKTVKRDSSQVRQGMADYLLVFRRPPAEGLLSARPIERPNGLSDYCGDSDPTADRYHPAKGARTPSQDAALAVWQRYAEPVWWDIDQMDTLNEQAARESQDEKHICPLQLGLIRRVVRLWSQPGEVVFSPFAGIGSEGYVSVQEGRRFVGVELKKSYWERACLNLTAAASQPLLPGMEAA